MAEYEALAKRAGGNATAQTGKSIVRATGRLRTHSMNKTEAEYAGRLQCDLMTREILWFRYEGVTLKLADDTRYTPDFAVLRSDGTLEMHEVKGGFMRDDSWVKLKVAAEQFPFQFILARKQKGEWHVKQV